MPRLAKRFTVVAVDLPGIGKSAPATHGYDTVSLAADVHALADSLKLERPYVVGHDLGAHVTYAYVRRFPEALRGAMILDVPMPGLAGSEEAGKGFWHVGFIMEPGLAEKLVLGRQAAFLDYFFNMGAVHAGRARLLHSGLWDAAAACRVRDLPRDSEERRVQRGTDWVQSGPADRRRGREVPVRRLARKVC